MSDKVVEAWRPFIAEAPDYEQTIPAGDSLRIDLTDILRQGAVDITDFHSPLDETKDPYFYNADIAKRGWYYDVAVIGQPKFGSVTMDEHKQGFLYKSDSDFIGEDCFNYILTNGKQISNTGKVIIDVTENYTLHIVVDVNSNGQYRFKASVSTPEGADPISKIFYRWYYLGPMLDAGEVVLGKQQFYSTRIRGRYNGLATIYSVIDPGNVWGYGTPRHETDFEGIIDSRTGLPFVPIDRFNDIEVVAYLRLNSKGWGSSIDLVLRKRLSDFLGRPWEQNGSIVDPNAPGTGTVAGIFSPVFMKDSSIVDKDLYDQVPEVE